MEKKVIVIAGPTASGKTDLSIKVAQYYDTEIISADSRQFFKYLDIGTAKPSAVELAKVKHHFIDLLNLNDDYDVSKFEIDALKIINEVHRKGKIPVVVGGSGLYIKGLVDGIFQGPGKDDDFREEMKVFRERWGDTKLYDLLKEKDPISAEGMLPSNHKRVIRALEVLRITGEPIWKLHQNQKRNDDLEFFQFAIDWERELLYRNIEKRVDFMIEAGLEQELRKILEMGYSASLNSLNTVGYKEMNSYICNEISLDSCIKLIKRNTRRYAKRQLTWFRADKRINWMKKDINTNLKFILSVVNS
jgi:tRNA dimethylallyltransferase